MTKMNSCRAILDPLDLTKGANASLLMARYVKELDDQSASRLSLFEAVKIAAKRAKGLYVQAFADRREVLSVFAASKIARTYQPVVAGLGNGNVLETGLTLNHTYGLPMLPGSSLKGITAHYCSEVLGKADTRYKAPSDGQAAGEIYAFLFGKSYPANEQEAGFMTFYDAWLVPDSVEGAFIDDVMTPHHSDYYTGKQPEATDFDDPQPVRFLAVQGEFELWLSCEGTDEESRKQWTDLTFKMLGAALRECGIGSKTRSAYGRMNILQPPKEKKAAPTEFEGFAHKVGDKVTVICEGVNRNRNLVFKIEGCKDGKYVEFLPPPPNARKGSRHSARVMKIEPAGNKYKVKGI